MRDRRGGGLGGSWGLPAEPGRVPSADELAAGRQRQAEAKSGGGPAAHWPVRG